MFEGKEVFVTLAQAGAGKTKHFMDIIAKELEVRRPEELAFVTFTKKGAEEGVRRMCNDFMFEASDLPYFRTLHSLTFRALNLKSNQMFNRIHERRFNKEAGYNLNRCSTKTGVSYESKDSRYLDYYDLERSGALTGRMLSEADIELGYYHRLVQKYEAYKKQLCLVDFFDCLIKYVQVGESLPVKVAFIDEAQDITLLQWKVIEKAFANAETVYITGDTSQSIYTYSGARPDILLSLARQYNLDYLTASYRIPRKVFNLASSIVSFISEKIEEMPFEFREGNPEGNIYELEGVDRLKNFLPGSMQDKKGTRWYLLARNNCFLREYEEVLEENLVPYWNCDGFFMGGEILRRLTDYLNFSKEGYKNEVKKEEFKKKFGIEDFSKPFTDTNLFTEDRKWVYASYLEKYGLKALKEMCKWEPQILVSTIHYVKGGEADNVAILTSSTRKTTGGVFKNIDEELRVLYVGVTRAKRNLFIIDTTGDGMYNKIINTIKDQFGLEW